MSKTGIEYLEDDSTEEGIETVSNACFVEEPSEDPKRQVSEDPFHENADESKEFTVDDETWEISRFICGYPTLQELDLRKKYNLKGDYDFKKQIGDSGHLGKDVDTAILFSGGYDSLSLALRHLEKGECVSLLSINFCAQEQFAAFLSFLILKSLYKDRVYFNRLLGQIVLHGMESTAGLTQQPTAAFLSTFMPEHVRSTAKTLEIAYCMNDDAISYLTEIRKLYYTAFNFKALDDKNFKIPKIVFPLTKTKHCSNITYVEAIESRESVIFPVLSAERCVVGAYNRSEESNKKFREEFYTIDCDYNSKKENKMCRTTGYFIKRVRKIDKTIF